MFCGFVGGASKRGPVDCGCGHIATLLAAGAFHFSNSSHHNATQGMHFLNCFCVINGEYALLVHNYLAINNYRYHIAATRRGNDCDVWVEDGGE
jgi:hypothetical protein